MKVEVSAEMHSVCPVFVGACITANIKNTEYSAELWREIDVLSEEYRATLTTESLKQMESIQATRRIYKLCGKDPSRYRPSNEQLVRRILQGKELWTVNTAVDIGNLVSIDYGYSVGCFDYDKIQGNDIVLGVGRAGEPYEGIGRGVLNIEGMPVYRDSAGGIGTPTSDNERTKMSLATTRMLAVVNGYDGNENKMDECLRFMVAAYEKYLGAVCETVKF